MSLQSPQPLLFTDNYFSESDAGYAGLIEKLSQSIEATKEFSQMISSRFAAEEQYALDVLKVINDYECTETGALKTSINTNSTLLENKMWLHEKFSVMLKGKVLSTTQIELGDTQKALRKKVEIERENYNKAVEKEQAALQKASSIYISKCKELVTQPKKLMSVLSTVKVRTAKISTEVNMAETDLRVAIDKINQLYEDLDQKFLILANELQILEHERFKQTKMTLDWMVACQIEFFDLSATSDYQKMPAMLKSVNAIRIMNDFVEKNQTGAELPSRFQFNSYFQDSVEGGDSAQSGNLEVLLKVDALFTDGKITESISGRPSGIESGSQQTDSLGRPKRSAGTLVNRQRSGTADSQQDIDDERESMKRQMEELKKLVAAQSLQLDHLGSMRDSKDGSSKTHSP